MGNDACKAGLYQGPSLPLGEVEVRVSVYKLDVTGIGLLDAIGGGLVGLYHSGVVIGANEWAFGGHDEAGKPGVFKTPPEQNEDFIFYRRVIMGNVQYGGVMETVKKLAFSKEWAGPRYDLFERNCNHFTSDLCWALLKKRPPEWINETATGLARTCRRLRAQRRALAEGLQRYAAQHGGAPRPHVASASGGRALESAGALAFREEFPRTFDEACRVGMRQGLAEARKCGAGQDPEQLRKQVEESVLDAAQAAAAVVAAAAARAARAAEEARAGQPDAGLPAWDAAWRGLSLPLVRSWREAAAAAAAAAALREQQHLRAQQLQATLGAQLEAARRGRLEAAARGALAGEQELGAQVTALLERAAAAAQRAAPRRTSRQAAVDASSAAAPLLQSGPGGEAGGEPCPAAGAGPGGGEPCPAAGAGPGGGESCLAAGAVPVFSGGAYL